MTSEMAVRLLGPPEAEGEYVALRESGRSEDLVHLHDYERLYDVPGLYEHIVQDLLGVSLAAGRGRRTRRGVGAA